MRTGQSWHSREKCIFRALCSFSSMEILEASAEKVAWSWEPLPGFACSLPAGENVTVSKTLGEDRERCTC